MDRAIAKIGRQNHLNHILNTLPFITVVFGLQCFLIYSYTSGVNTGDYAIILSAFIVSFILGLVYYDKNHHVIIYPTHLHVYFGLTGTNKIIQYAQISEIITTEKEQSFSSLILKMKDNRYEVFYFVDYPIQVKQLIEDQMGNGNNTASNDDDQQLEDAA